MKIKQEYKRAERYFNNQLHRSAIQYNRVKVEDEDSDDIMIRGENGLFVGVDAYFTRFHSPEDQFAALVQQQEKEFDAINTYYNNLALQEFMKLAINRILQRMQAHACTQVTNLVIGVLSEEQWQLLYALSDLECRRTPKTKQRCVNGSAVAMPVQRLHFNAKHRSSFWTPEQWGKRYYDYSNHLHRLIHCELNYVTLKFSQYDKRVTASFSYKVWKYMQDNEVAHVPSHWAPLNYSSK